MFLSVGILAIAGDITFLGGVLATLVGANLRDPLTQQTFARLAFSDPLLALERFPEVSVLTVSVLLVGFVLKLWHDAHRQHRRDPSDKAGYVIASVVSIGGVLMLAFVAAIRMQQPLDSDDSHLGRFASTMLGLVLPAFGTVCVMTGMDRLGALSRLLWHTACRPLLNWRLRPLVTAQAEAQKCLIEAEQAVNAAAGAGRATEIALLLEAEFKIGYRDGVASAMASTAPGATSALVRRAAVGRVVMFS
jgi:hypothetical protein